jgi:cytoskeletal protein CcmA (bactofilin family)
METVNGKISATGSHIKGNIETVNGNIFLDEGTVVEGDVIVEKSTGWFNSNSKVPEVYIGKNVVVEGDLIFKKKVKLHIDSSAKTGEVIGDSVVDM